jgi:hypothetical protein
MLDPERVKLDAAHIGFLARTGQKVDMDKVKMFLQTDDSGVIKVRREAETPVNELHVMGGQRYGMEGNMNLQDYSRQARQINGYPLRSFSATAPAVVLPPKYGGFPRYVENEGERTDYVSRFTEPISAALQQNTILLGREGYTVSNNSASDPFIPMGFDMNMFKTKDAIDQNEYQHSMKRYLERVENQRIAKSRRGGGGGSAGRSAGPFGGYKGGAGPTGMGGIGGDQLVEGSQVDKKDLRGSFKGGMGRRIGINDGVFIGSNGDIMTQVSSVNNAMYMTANVFNNYASKQNAIMSQKPIPAMNNPGLYNMPSNQGNGLEMRVKQEVLENNASIDLFTPNESAALNKQALVENNFANAVDGPKTGMQPASLLDSIKNAAGKTTKSGRIVKTPKKMSPQMKGQSHDLREMLQESAKKLRKTPIKEKQATLQPAPFGNDLLRRAMDARRGKIAAEDYDLTDWL